MDEPPSEAVAKTECLKRDMRTKKRQDGRQDDKPAEKTAFVGKKFTKKFKVFKGKCFKCQKFGHWGKKCRNGEAHVAANSVCFMADRNSVDSRSVTRQKVTLKLDSGASDHMAKEDGYF